MHHFTLPLLCDRYLFSIVHVYIKIVMILVISVTCQYWLDCTWWSVSRAKPCHVVGHWEGEWNSSRRCLRGRAGGDQGPALPEITQHATKSSKTGPTTRFSNIKQGKNLSFLYHCGLLKILIRRGGSSKKWLLFWNKEKIAWCSLGTFQNPW